MQPLTIVYPFFNHHVTFEHHLKAWESYGDSLLKLLEFIIVDDNSYIPIKIYPQFSKLNISIYRVMDDIIWNYGAKNLGIEMSSNNWFLLSELDHLVSREACEKILQLPRNDRNYYMFRRKNYASQADSRYIDTIHPATYCMSKSTFYAAGGIDEDFSGAYGYDDIFLTRCLQRKKYKKVVPNGIELRNFSDNLEFPDADLKQDSNVPRSTARNFKIFQSKIKTMEPSKSKIRFKWEKVYP